MDDVVCSEVHTFNAGVAEEGAAGLRIATFRFSLPHSLPLSIASEVWCLCCHAVLFQSYVGTVPYQCLGPWQCCASMTFWYLGYCTDPYQDPRIRTSN
jgi:hypothetical protein